MNDRICENVQAPVRGARRAGLARAALAAALSALCLTVLWVAVAGAGPPEVALEIVPAAVEISAGKATRVLVVARSPITAPLRDVRLSWYGDAGVTVAVQEPPVDVLGPYGTLLWALDLSQAGEARPEGKLHLRLDYNWQADDAAVPTARVALGSIEVQPRAPDPAPEVAQIEIQTAIESLAEKRPGMLYLVVANTTDVPVRIVGWQVDAPSFVTLTLTETLAGTTLGPGEARRFPFEVSLNATQRSGKHLLLFQVELEWQRLGRTWTRGLVAGREIETGVLLESELLTALNVPSFLILPGFLMLVTYLALWQRVWPQHDLKLTLKAPEFWLIAVSLSLGALWLVPIVSAWLGSPRDYLEGYGLLDVQWAWGLSIALGGLYYLIRAGALALRRRYIRTRVRPAMPDTPVEVLVKLDTQGLGMFLERVTYTAGGQTGPVLVLEERSVEQTRVWVAPAIEYRWTENATRARRRAVDEESRAEGDAGTMARLLQEAEEAGELTLRWAETALLTGPTYAQVESLGPAIPGQGFIVMEA